MRRRARAAAVMTATMVAATLSAGAATATSVGLTTPASSATADGRAAESLAVQLPAPAAVGQTAELTVMVDSDIASATTSGPLSLDLGVSREVAAVDDATGAYSTRSVIGDIAVNQTPLGFDVSALEAVRGMAVYQQFDPTGTPLDPGIVENPVSSAQTDGGGRLFRMMAVTTVGYPAEPVAVGASWSSTGAAADASGINIDVVYHCRLVAVDGGTFTIEVSFAQDFSIADPVHGQIDGTISGQGTLQGSLDNVLVINGAINQTVDGITKVNGDTSPLSVASTIQITSR